MLGFNDQYNVLHGIYITFSGNGKKRLLVSKHKADTRDKVKGIYPYRKYETWTKENLVLLGLHIMLNEKPSSFQGMLQLLIDEDTDKKVKYFKDIIMNYKSYIIEDVEKIIIKFGEKPTFENMFKLYIDKEIKFYTLWWFLVYSGEDIDSICKLRIKGTIIKRIKQMNLFLTFKESNLVIIKKTLQEKLNLDEDI
jgi:hypothetical protein